jgi:hypothetical protein
MGLTMTSNDYSLYGLPCDVCGHAAHHIEVYPNGIRTVHLDRRQRPCDAVRPAPNHASSAVAGTELGVSDGA